MKRLASTLAIGAILATTAAGAWAWQERLGADLEGLADLYRELHAAPEISYGEKETARRLAGELAQLGFAVTERVGDYGVEGRVSYGFVGVMENGDGPVVMVRTDLDGLPVEEETGLPYASRHRVTTEQGEEVATMHACGHDLHMAAFVGVARVLASERERWSGTLVMIGQPAEERGAGAKAMLEDGLYRRFPRPDYVLALHANATLPAGTIGVVPGYALANVDSVDLTVRGAGGHGAYPHTTHDPVTLAAKIVMALQTIVSRQVSPLDPAVITVGSIHGGTKHNIIPNQVELQLTVRSYKPEVRRLLLDSIRRTAVETAAAAGFPDELAPIVVVRVEESTPSTYNDPDLAARLLPVWRQALGEEAVRELEPVMGGEDFSRYALEGEIPIQMFWLGAVDPAAVERAAASGESLPSLHSSRFAPLPEPALATGVTAMTAAVLELMGGR